MEKTPQKAAALNSESWLDQKIDGRPRKYNGVWLMQAWEETKFKYMYYIARLFKFFEHRTFYTSFSGGLLNE